MLSRASLIKITTLLSLPIIGAMMSQNILNLIDTAMVGVLGAGAVAQVLRVSIITQWLIGVALAWLVGPYLGWGLIWIWITNGLYRILQTGIFAALWHRGHWAQIKI